MTHKDDESNNFMVLKTQHKPAPKLHYPRHSEDTVSRLSWTLACIILLTSCADDGSGKGEEEYAFDEYEEKADSFSQPTEHGLLVFGIAQSAELTDDHLFHAWDFTLSDVSAVTITTELITPNLDTVMYLYQRDPETGRWGRYLARNDDYDGTVASQISRDLAPGEYRVLVKGHKAALRGSFTVVAVCEGDGCQQGDGECVADSYLPLPDDFGTACGEALSEAMSGAFESSGATTIAIDEHCSLPEAARLGLDYYYSYWDGLVGFEDMFDYYYDEPIEVEVSWIVYSNGSTYVSADGGGDEAAMDFLINADGQLVAFYQHNQSPDFQLFCDNGETYADEECGFIYMDAFLADEITQLSDGTVDGVTQANARELLDRVAFLAAEDYRRELELAAETALTVDAETWENQGWGDWEAAGRVAVSAEGQETYEYELAAASTTQWLFTLARGDSEREFSCTEL